MNIDRGHPFSWDAVGTSNGYNCFFNFPPVPKGKLLVIRHVGALVRPNANSTILDIAELVTSTPDDTSVGVRNYFGMSRIGQVGASVGYDSWSMNHPLLAYVVAGQYARMTINLRQPGSILFCQASISGLMVNDDRSDRTDDDLTAG